ncbi:hypothetical protein, partial [Streptomyces tauricus]|uniref:hypothetical protein n=1 Tax=Streptomyces tauricus TaxID=68274 RepID=UPI0033B01B21
MALVQNHNLGARGTAQSFAFQGRGERRNLLPLGGAGNGAIFQLLDVVSLGEAAVVDEAGSDGCE